MKGTAIEESVLQEVVSFLNQVLSDTGKETSNHNYYYYCPFCNHHKRKLTINIKSGQFNCWTCPDTNHTKGRSLFSLLKKLHVPPQKYKELEELIGSHAFKYSEPDDKELEEVKLYLPEEFEPLWGAHKKDMWWIRAYNYCVKDRGLTDTDIKKYCIGYCKTGQYEKRLIIPSYNKHGELNYFTGRDITGAQYLKYKNPPISRNIIGFEWWVNFGYPVILVEGMLDAIKMGDNAVPMLSKKMPPVLQDALLSSPVQDVYIGLDEDAKKDMAEIALDLQNNGKVVHWIPMPKGKDLGDLTHEECLDLLYNKSFESSLRNVILNKLSNVL